MSETTPQKKTLNREDCLYWVQYFLSKRTHSEKELQEKLEKKGFHHQEIQDNLKLARQKKWLEDPLELAARLTEKWHLENKSFIWIENYLTDKGLPTLEYKSDLETKKAAHLLAKKFVQIDKENYNKARQHLASRGFTQEDFEGALTELGFESPTDF